MSDLRSLVTITPVTASSVQMQVAVFNSNIASVTNGGCCCCWVVPAGVTWATFEVWGGGGDGGGEHRKPANPGTPKALDKSSLPFRLQPSRCSADHTRRPHTGRLASQVLMGFE